MIQIINDLACSLFCIMVNGFTAMAVWFIYQKITRPFGYCKQTYLLIRLFIFFMLIPWQYILLRLYEVMILHGWWRIVPQYYISIVMSVILLVWLAGAIRKGIRVLYPFYLQKGRLKDRENADIETEKRYRSIASDMDIRLVPRLYTTDECVIPFLFHSFPATIYLPKNLMDQNQMEVSLRHELTHYMHRDHVWAWLLRICGIIQWWNPFIKCLEQQYSEWSEYANDNDIIGRSFKKNYYFETIMDILETHGERNVFAQNLGTEALDDIEMRMVVIE